MDYKNGFLSLILIYLLAYSSSVSAQVSPQNANAVEIYEQLKKLNTLGSVLYVAAHPDDENTHLIAYLSKGEKMNVNYLALTRGDGGQNLIGTQIGERLGMIRTQELLQARRIDGGEQYFTRALDFGFSKNPDETFGVWDKQQLLGDVVWMIRKLQPDVIITRFNTTPGGNHGHHTASAILAEEAFDLAGDPKAYPEQLKYVKSWQPKRLFWNTYNWEEEPADLNNKQYYSFNVGSYNPLIGQSYTEIAAKSRTMHKSQGFGSSPTRDYTRDNLKFVKGEPFNSSYLDGVDTSWRRITNGSSVGQQLDQLIASYDFLHPEKSLDGLLQVRTNILKLPSSYLRDMKLQEIEKLIQDILGLFIELRANESSLFPGAAFQVTLSAVLRNDASVMVKRVSILNKEMESNLALKKGVISQQALSLILPSDYDISQPYWLEETPNNGFFEIEGYENLGLAENRPAISAEVELVIADQSMVIDLPLVYKRTDPVDGEVYFPISIEPAINTQFKEKLLVITDQEEKLVDVVVSNNYEATTGKVYLSGLPAGWNISPASYEVTLDKGQSVTKTFKIKANNVQTTTDMQVVFEVNGIKYSRGREVIDYPHIPRQVFFPNSALRVAKVNVNTLSKKIGYIVGAGDEVPEVLRQLGYQVNLLSEEDLTLTNLSQYDAIIAGIRAYNTVEHLNQKQDVLFEYVKKGGNFIVQYNTNSRLVTNNLAPFPLQLSRDRITVEESAVNFLLPNHPFMKAPNQLTQADFEGWVQERGLYFPNQWDSAFQAFFSGHDPGETDKSGALLIAPYGKGHYIYTGYSWFRQLPAGVPGAIRIFVNMIETGKNQTINGNRR